VPTVVLGRAWEMQIAPREDMQKLEEQTSLLELSYSIAPYVEP
jgi:hypothetical protein